MRHALRYAALAAAIAVTGSVAHARPHHRAKVATSAKKAKHAKQAKRARHHRAAPRVEEARDEDAQDAVDVALRVQDEDEDVEDAESPDEIDTPVALHEKLTIRAKDWHIAIGPYAWASAVDASVSVGGMKVDSPVDFAKLKHDIKYGGELLAEARHGRFAITGDLMFGAIGIESAADVGPLMVNVQGEVNSLLLDSAAGCLLVGDAHSQFAIEARGGIRYQRTAVKAQVTLEGAGVAQPNLVFAASDALVGTRVFVRPREKLSFTGSADVGVAGASSSTWSASIDASYRVSSHALLSLGYRTLTMDRSDVAVVLHGPRAAIQFVF